MATGTITVEGKAPRETTQEAVIVGGRSLTGTLVLSVLTSALLLGTLIALAGPWALLANTRALNVLIGGGVVKYHDRHAGFIQGIPNAEYYVASQDPINWMILALVLGAYLTIWGLKSLQFHAIARHYGIDGALAQHAGAYGYGLLYKETMPLGIGDAAAAAALRSDGAQLDRARATIFLFNSFLLFELTCFALLGLLGLGWANWLTQIFWALVIVGVLVLWTRPTKPVRALLDGPSVWRARLNHIAALLRQPSLFAGLAVLSLITFGLRDVAAYLTAMAFSTQNVLLNIDPSLILMGVVGGYIATLIRVTPGGIGQFEWGFTAALFIGGVGLPEAATVAILVSFFRYSALLLLFLSTTLWRRTRTTFREATALFTDIAWQRALPASPQLPALAAQPVPAAALLWRRALLVAGAALVIFFFDRITLTLSDRWLLESLGLGNVFAINFGMSVLLFSLAALGTFAVFAVPAFTYAIAPEQRSFILGLGFVLAILAGYTMSLRYLEFLLYRGGGFGQVDPIFGNDIGFYVFQLPGMWLAWSGIAVLSAMFLCNAIVCAMLAGQRSDTPPSGISGWLATTATPTTFGAIGLIGLVAAGGFWLSRFNLLLKDSYAATVFVGPSYVDVNGFLSTNNQLLFSALVACGVAAALMVMLRALAISVRKGQPAWNTTARRAGLLAATLIGLDFAFAAGVAIRDTTLVAPNQPVIQLPYIEHHIAATRAAYGFNNVQEIDLRPRADDAELPSVERLMNSPTLRNAPLWPTFVNYVERLVDPQHADRVLLTGGDTMIYGPTLEIFQQKQKLRTYYNFLDIDALRFPVNGETRLYASAVRELPILEPQPWLAWWGQRFMLFTHGHGLVMAPVNEFNAEGEPTFASSAIPVTTADPILSVVEQQIYYGEGAGSMAVSNVRNMSEFDYPTERDRAVNILPSDNPAGVHIDSPLKRLVFAWRSGEFFAMLFSSLITPETRLHYYRQPLDRLEHIVPFLYLDSDPYAIPADGRILWMVNGMTTSAHYPFSMWADLGDKSMSRSRETVDTRLVNYVEDSVKATIDATTGQVTLYQIADSPVISAWSRVYPGLFTDGALMPESVRRQMTYPLQLFHTQFDDLYIYYHMNDPMYFFNMEDMWDDSDEVLGPILDEGQSITFSIEPKHMLLETGGALPESSSPTQFAKMLAFTPEGARNLRAVPIVYQDGDDYGKLAVLEVPKGMYVVGPEQADAIIDQDPDISEQIALWNRKGTEVIRGHTLLMLIDNELFYIEPLFIRSKQNAITQLKQVAVVFRGKAYMAPTLEDALTLAIASHRSSIAEAAQP